MYRLQLYFCHCESFLCKHHHNILFFQSIDYIVSVFIPYQNINDEFIPQKEETTHETNG